MLHSFSSWQLQGGPQNQRPSAIGGSLGRSDLPLVQVKTLKSSELTPPPIATEQGWAVLGEEDKDALSSISVLKQDQPAEGHSLC